MDRAVVDDNRRRPNQACCRLDPRPIRRLDALAATAAVLMVRWAGLRTCFGLGALGRLLALGWGSFSVLALRPSSAFGGASFEGASLASWAAGFFSSDSPALTTACRETDASVSVSSKRRSSGSILKPDSPSDGSPVMPGLRAFGLVAAAACSVSISSWVFSRNTSTTALILSAASLTSKSASTTCTLTEWSSTTPRSVSL